MQGKNYLTAPGVHATKDKALSMQRLIELSANYFEMTVPKLLSKQRERPIVTARQWIMYIANQKFNHTLVSIGKAMGGRDHTTVIHSVNTVNNLCFSDRKYKESFEQYKIYIAALM